MAAFIFYSKLHVNADMLSRRLLTISLLLTGISGYLIFFADVRGLFWLLGLSFIGAMLAYVFQHQLNWWWYRRYPPSFPQEIEAMYLRSAVFYIGLGAADREKFKTRVRLFVEAKEFIAQGFDEVAEEIKYIIAYYAIATSFTKKKYLYDPYDRIVIYLHPFLSPNFSDQVHAYEIEHEDGTLIFSLEQLTAGFLHPHKYYQIGFHVFAELFQKNHLKHVAEKDYGPLWKSLADLAWSKETVEDFTGMEQISPRPMMMHYWFSHADAMQTQAPELYKQVSDWMSAE